MGGGGGNPWVTRLPCAVVCIYNFVTINKEKRHPNLQDALTLIELSTDPEKRRPLEMARQVTLLSCRTRVCAHVMCSKFHT